MVRKTFGQVINDDVLGPYFNPTTKKGVTVVSREGDMKGKTTGGCYRCRMEGCTGIRIATRWEDGHMTYPCSKGMRRHMKSWRIL